MDKNKDLEDHTSLGGSLEALKSLKLFIKVISKPKVYLIQKKKLCPHCPIWVLFCCANPYVMSSVEDNINHENPI